MLTKWQTLLKDSNNTQVYPNGANIPQSHPIHPRTAELGYTHSKSLNWGAEIRKHYISISYNLFVSLADLSPSQRRAIWNTGSYTHMVHSRVCSVPKQRLCAYGRVTQGSFCLSFSLYLHVKARKTMCCRLLQFVCLAFYSLVLASPVANCLCVTLF